MHVMHKMRNAIQLHNCILLGKTKDEIKVTSFHEHAKIGVCVLARCGLSSCTRHVTARNCVVIMTMLIFAHNKVMNPAATLEAIQTH